MGKKLFRVMVVDDEEDVRQILSTILEEAYEVTAATNGLDALLKINKHEPDLIIADVMMPLLDGYDLTKRIRTTSGFEKTPIILVSALDSRDEMKKGYSCGADVFLPKPFDPERVMRNVTLSLDDRQPRPKKMTAEQIRSEMQKQAQDTSPSRDSVGKEYDVIKNYRDEKEKSKAPPKTAKAPTPPKPVAKPVPAPAPTPAPEPKAPEIPIRVMIVDDDPDIVEFVETALKGGFEVVPAFDGMDAVRKIPTMQPDVFVIDGMMPKMSGYQLVEVLKQSAETHKTPIIFISARDLPRDRVMLSRRGVDLFVAKPFSTQQLTDALTKVTTHPDFKAKEKSRPVEELLQEEGEKMAGVEEIRQRKNYWNTYGVLQGFLKDNKKKDPFNKKNS